MEEEFVDLLNREMERLQGYWKGKKEPQTAIECEELVRPFVYKIEELTAHNYIKDQRIAELEEQLKNAIVPKFKIGQEVWFVNETLEVMHKGKINAFEIYKFNNRPYEFWYDIDYVEDNTEFSDEVSDEFIFATKEEAQAKLKELTAKNV